MSDHHTPPSLQHVVIGAGPVGSGTALRLADRGDRVVVVTRSGSGPVHPNVRLVTGDASDPVRLAEISNGASTIFNCANPQYHRWATDWPPLATSILDAAERVGARVATMGNLYVYASNGTSMSATDDIAAPTRKGAVRAQMWNQALAAHRAGRVEVTEIRASDFFGPGVGASAQLGDRFVPRLLAGTSVSMIGRTDQAHSWTYIDDVTRTLADLGTDDRAFGRAWHVPTVAPRTVEEMANLIGESAGVSRARIRHVPAALLRVIGIVSPVLRELPEMLYQFDRPFVIDDTDTVDTFAVTATPLAEQIVATVAAYRDHP